jgi:cold shock CspA family protein
MEGPGHHDVPEEEAFHIEQHRQEGVAMEIEPQVSFRNVERNDALDRQILKGIDKLGTVHDRITSVRMAVEDQRGSGIHDHLYRVRIEITVPGREIVVKETPGGDPHPPLDQVLNQAFDAAFRKLREERRQQKGGTKEHVPRGVGRVIRIFPNEGYGFIEDDTGREVYFHRNSVSGKGWDALDTGTGVEFREEQGDKGPQAIVVHPMA